MKNDSPILKNKISVVLTTHNEEKNIEKCLSSVQVFADEIIVVDGESTDKTVSIAKSLGAKVFSTTNKQNFHINKQMAMDKATGTLVLQMDADEIVDAELAQFIKMQQQKISKSNLTSFQPKAWYLKRKNFFLGRWLSKGGQYPDPVIRLYINGFAQLPQKDVHEQMTVQGEVDTAEGHLLHYPNPTFQNYLTHSFDRYTSFTAKKWFDSKVKTSFLMSIKYLFVEPLKTFFWIYIRHKGFVDGIPGLIFATFSGLHFAIAYLKLKELYEEN